MQLADALSHCPARASQEIKLDMGVDYIAFTKLWIEKLKDSTQRDPVLATVYQLTQQGWPHQRRHIPRLARRYWDFIDELSTDDGMLLNAPSDARNVSKGLRYPRCPSCLMTSQRVLGGNLVLIILPSTATHMS